MWNFHTAEDCELGENRGPDDLQTVSQWKYQNRPQLRTKQNNMPNPVSGWLLLVSVPAKDRSPYYFVFTSR